MITNRCLLLPIITILLLTNCAGEITIIEEQFSESKNEEWAVPSSSEIGDAKIDNGKLMMTCNDSNLIFDVQTCMDGFDGSLSFKWESLIVQSFQNGSESYGGVVWGDYDSEYLNYFGYNEKKMVAIIKENSNGDTYLFKEVINDFDPFEVNKLSIIRAESDGNLKFLINDIVVHQLNYQDISVGLNSPEKFTCFGFWTSSHLEADYIKVVHTPF